MHSRRLDDFRSVLIRYGFDGYGHPEDDNGIVIFAADRLALKEVVAEVPSAESLPGSSASCFTGFADLEDVKRSFRRPGSERAKSLAEQVARRQADAGGEAELRR